jgi:hypothetical protein
MAQPSLQDVLGPGATQDATTITILKADLPGLTPAANNNGEQLFAGIVKRARVYLTDANQTNNPDQNITFGETFSRFVTRNDQKYRQNQIPINFQKLDNDPDIEPDEY